MRHIMIRLVFKKSDPSLKQHPKYYRPISLLNCDYKILSHILANRLKNHIHHVLDESQACAPKRTISDPIRSALSIIHRAKKDKTSNALLFLDFEKAFDSVDHDFLFRTMEKMNLGTANEDCDDTLKNDFIRWSKLAFTKTTAKCMINGKLSKGFNLPGGGRQGDNLFPLLFALVVHNLKLIIDHCPAQGIPIPNSNSTSRLWDEKRTWK